MSTNPWPEDPAAIVAALDRRARRVETPCGNGALVWRAWGEGPPVILAHGGYGSWTHWIKTIDALACDRTVWVPDLPGHGESAAPPVETQRSICDALAVGLDRLLGGSPVDAVGFSFGGTMCAYLAAFHPGRLRRLILVDTGGLGTPMGTIVSQRVRGLSGPELVAAHRVNLLGLMLHYPDSVDELALHIQAENVARGRVAAAALVLPNKLIRILPEVRTQLDAIWGEHDRPHPPALQEPVLRRIQPDLEFRVVPDAGHWVMYERAEAFNRTLLDMLAQPLRPGG